MRGYVRAANMVQRRAWHDISGIEMTAACDVSQRLQRTAIEVTGLGNVVDVAVGSQRRRNPRSRVERTAKKGIRGEGGGKKETAVREEETRTRWQRVTRHRCVLAMRTFP